MFGWFLGSVGGLLYAAGGGFCEVVENGVKKTQKQYWQKMPLVWACGVRYVGPH